MNVKTFSGNNIEISMRAEFNENYAEWRVYITLTLPQIGHPSDGDARRRIELLEAGGVQVQRDYLLRVGQSQFPSEFRPVPILAAQGDHAIGIAAAQFSVLLRDAALVLDEDVP